MKPQLVCICGPVWRAAIAPVIAPLVAPRNELFSSVIYGSEPAHFLSLYKDAATSSLNSRNDDVGAEIADVKVPVAKSAVERAPLVLLLADGNCAPVIEALAEGSRTPPAENKQVASFDVLWMHSLFTGIDALDPPRLAAALAKCCSSQQEQQQQQKQESVSSLLLPPFTNSRGVFSEMLAQHCILSVLYFLRQVPLLIQRQSMKPPSQSAFWDRFPSPTTVGQKMLVVGMGDIGKTCAIRMKAGLGLREIVGIRSGGSGSGGPAAGASSGEVCSETGAIVHRGLAALDEQLPTADIVLCVLPAAAGLVFDAERCNRFKQGAVFINIGRGASVDEHAIAAALAENKLRGAALDVFEREPLPETSPLFHVDPSKILLTPHNADVSPTMKEDSAAFFVDLAKRVFEAEEQQKQELKKSSWQNLHDNAVLQEQYQVNLAKGY